MSRLPTLVYIVDDDASIRAAYARLVSSAKMEPRTFATVEEFMHADLPEENACVVSDVLMSGGNGLEMAALLLRTDRRLPVIFVTANPSRQTRNFAQRLGVAAYFRKPVDDQTLLDAIAWALGSQ